MKPCILIRTSVSDRQMVGVQGHTQDSWMKLAKIPLANKMCIP